MSWNFFCSPGFKNPGINIYRYLQILRVFPPDSCYESAKAIQFPHPGLKIIEQSWQIPRHAPGMAAWVHYLKIFDLHWPI